MRSSSVASRPAARIFFWGGCPCHMWSGHSVTGWRRKLGAARAISPGRSLRASMPFARSMLAALRHPAYAGQQRRLDGTGSPERSN